MKRINLVLLWLVLLVPVCVYGQSRTNPQTIIVRSGSLKLRALVWRPKGHGPYPALLFSTGSGQVPPLASLGPLFAKNGYVFLALYRRGQGISKNQGDETGSLVTRERANNGNEAANRLQLQLLEGEQLQETLDALSVLRSLNSVDQNRVAIVGHSFGGSLAMLVAERDASIRAVINFGGGAGSWNRSPGLRERLLEATRKLTAPVLYIHAANDYSTLPGEVIDAELARLGKIHQLRMYPAFGRTESEGHNVIFLSMGMWERDVFAFLDEHVKGSK